MFDAHSIATRLLDGGYDIKTIQELVEHRDVTTVMIYILLLNRGTKRGCTEPAGFAGNLNVEPLLAVLMLWLTGVCT